MADEDIAIEPNGGYVPHGACTAEGTECQEKKSDFAKIPTIIKLRPEVLFHCILVAIIRQVTVQFIS